MRQVSSRQNAFMPTLRRLDCRIYIALSLHSNRWATASLPYEEFNTLLVRKFACRILERRLSGRNASLSVGLLLLWPARQIEEPTIIEKKSQCLLTSIHVRSLGYHLLKKTACQGILLPSIARSRATAGCHPSAASTDWSTCSIKPFENLVICSYAIVKPSLAP